MTEEYPYTIEEIAEAQREAAELCLLGCGIFCSLPPASAQRLCNGIGAEWMPEGVRLLADRRHPTLKLPAMIHDVQYEYGTGTDEDFRSANYNLYANGCTMARRRYGWYNPVRYMVMSDAAKLANICDLFGRKAYDEAIEHHRKETAQQ